MAVEWFPVTAHAANGSQPKRVLCVDDDPAILQLHQHLLEGAGYFVLLAHSGAEALELLVRDHVDVVVLDNAMPGMNGDELAVKLRRRYPKLPLVAVSGVEELPACHAASS